MLAFLVSSQHQPELWVGFIFLVNGPEFFHISHVLPTVTQHIHFSKLILALVWFFPLVNLSVGFIQEGT